MDTIFRILFLILFISVLGVRIYFSRKTRQEGNESWKPTREAVRREGLGILGLRFGLFLALMGCFVIYLWNPVWIQALILNLPDWLRWSGAFLATAGVWLLIWVHQALGSNWSTNLQLQERHHLVEAGPYRSIRHPMYTALASIFIGLSLVSEFWPWFFLTLLSIAFFIKRVPKEEQMMQQEFNGEYDAYMRRSGRFLPPLGALSLGWQYVLQTAMFLLFVGSVLFLAAGTLVWPAAWVYLGLMAVCMAIAGIYLSGRNQEQLRERMEVKPRAGVSRWDVAITRGGRLLMLSLLLTSGLDRRFGWTANLPLTAQILAVMAGLAGFGLILWSLSSNPFAVAYARLQEERGQRVVQSGPYRYVRHPFYDGVLLYILALPVLLESLWALFPAALVACLFLARTNLEDRMLQAELHGYADYASQVRYRLLPGVW
jgi:protein-S-isoprenylcysteine O-methyltransferase Ste14